MNPTPTNPTTEQPPKSVVRPRWFSAKELLVALLVLFLATPAFAVLKQGELIEAVLVTAVLLSAVLAVSGRRGTLVVAIVLLLPALVGQWLDHFHPGVLPAWVFQAAFLTFLGFVVVNLFGFVMRASRVDSEVLCAGVAIYILLGLIWANAYILAAQSSSPAFALAVPDGNAQVMGRFNALYFSFITLSTVGFGDIVPVSRLARTLTMLEAITGLFYMGIFIARLVSLYSTAAKSEGVKR
ncbi:MAG: hypothetical protein PCFJNLEI_02554 [Verrucomicrobiae bacterium]|nr:hypothetical protein [Verrucomicrobiae bacterium]